jgi:hypothetical protein
VPYAIAKLEGMQLAAAVTQDDVNAAISLVGANEVFA